ncbi:MAG: TrkA family potassium uptake protein [Candidatus Binatia bacterium]
MRIVFVGAGELAVRTAKSLIKDGHEVVIIERDREKITELSEELDCSFLHGDGGKPAILREAGPEQTDILFCLSDNDQANIIASLVARSLGFRRVVTRIHDSEFEGICHELGLEETIIPGRTISRYLEDMVRGLHTIELGTILKNNARFFSFTVESQDAKAVAEIDFPEDTRVVCYYRGEQFYFADPETKLREGDEVILLTHSKHLPVLQERWEPGRSRGNTEEPVEK